MAVNLVSDDTSARNLRDFLLLYNKLTEQCFERCISDLKTKIVSTKEQNCVTVCTDRYVGFNQKTMFVFMEHQKLREAAQLKEYELATQKAAAAESSPTPETVAQATTESSPTPKTVAQTTTS